VVFVWVFAVGEELETNPFMRVSEPTVQAFVRDEWDSSVGDYDVATMAILRRRKDTFGVGAGVRK
jgi:hypothetical protein